MERLIRQLLNTLAKLSNSEYIALLKVEESNLTGVLVGGLNKEEFVLPGRRLEFSNTPLERIIATKQINTYPAMLVEALPVPVYQGTKDSLGCLCMPFLNDDNTKVSGMALLLQKTIAPLPPERMQFLNASRDLFAAVMEMATESDYLIQMATKDSLTGLYSRLYFESRLQEEFSRVRRHGGVMSLLLIDVDRFKQINETCGYSEGNGMLQEIAKLISSSIRKEIDIPCRYGGERFTLLLPNTDVDGAYVLGDRIRKKCEQHRFTTQKGIPLKITVSIGIAHNVDVALDEAENELVSPPVNLLSKEELIYRADMMLYAAKQAGRNQIMVWW